MGAICSPGTGDDLTDDEMNNNNQKTKSINLKAGRVNPSDIDKIDKITKGIVKTIFKCNENDPTKAHHTYDGDGGYRVKICVL